MSVSWNNEYTPAQVLNKLEDIRRKGESGKVSFIGWGFSEYKSLLYSMLNFSDDISENDARDIVQKSIFNMGNKGIISASKFLSEINRLEKEYRDLPVRRYVLVSSISLSTYTNFPNILLGKTLIAFEPSLPQIFHNEANKLLSDAEKSLFASLPNNYTNIKIFVSAKSLSDAAIQALDAIDFVRGVWNWANNRKHLIRKS
jgi:hypothetical protein